MTDADYILFIREKQGLFINLIVRSIALILSIAGHIVVHHSIEEVIRIIIISICIFTIIGYLFFMLINNKNLKFIGYTGTVIDSILLCFLPYNWYLSVGFYEKVPAVYLFKTSLPIMAILVISINSLALRPIYPLILAIVFNCIWVFIYFLIKNDPRTSFTNSFLDNFFSEKIFIDYYLTLSMTVTGIALILSYIVYSYRKSIKQAVKLEVKTNQLSRYFSPNVLKEIEKNESIFDAKKTHVVVVFIDIRDFTSISESMDPTSLVQLLRDYHAWVVNLIYEYGGTIDKFIGDGILITFGTPIPKTDDSIRAIRFLQKLFIKLEEFNENRNLSQLPKISLGVGVHYGEVVVGNIGSEDRLEYTVIGDTVNLSSRLEALCKDFKVNNVLSSDLIDIIQKNSKDEFIFQELGQVKVRGKSNSIMAYSLKM